MNFDELQTLLEYHYWARDRLLDAVEPLTAEQFTRDLSNSFASIRDTVAHLYGVDWVWCSRWEGVSPDGLPDPKQFPTVATLRTAWQEQERRVRTVVTRLGPEGILRPIAYQRNGLVQAQVFWQMVQHLVNHGSYHRGQVTTMLRQVGAEPPRSMDMIAFYRVRTVGA